LNEPEDLDRLRWHCRRGMLELDAWLTAFLEQRYAGLPCPLRADFAALLAHDDMSLFAWLTGADEPPDALRAVLAQIKLTRHMTT